MENTAYCKTLNLTEESRCECRTNSTTSSTSLTVNTVGLGATQTVSLLLLRFLTPPLLQTRATPPVREPPRAVPGL